MNQFVTRLMGEMPALLRGGGRSAAPSFAGCLDLLLPLPPPRLPLQLHLRLMGELSSLLGGGGRSAAPSLAGCPGSAAAPAAMHSCSWPGRGVEAVLLPLLPLLLVERRMHGPLADCVHLPLPHPLQAWRRRRGRAAPATARRGSLRRCAGAGAGRCCNPGLGPDMLHPIAAPGGMADGARVCCIPAQSSLSACCPRLLPHPCCSSCTGS